MKKTGLICLALCLILVIQSLMIPAAATEQDAQNQEIYGCHTVDAKNTLLGNGELVKNVQSAFLYETKSQTLMYAWNADTPMDPASLVKIMTAYVAIEKGDLDDLVTVNGTLLESLPESAPVVGFQADEILTLEDLLYGLLVCSANDAALVIAEHISGNEAQFVAEMNSMARELGCQNTSFVNSTGFYDEAQVTTARDIARILEAALQNEVFRTMFCTAEYTVPATNKSDKRYIITGNYLFADNEDDTTRYVDSRVKGGRTGSANNGLRAVAAVAESGTLELISVVMGSESEYAENGYSTLIFGGYQETSALLDAGFDNMKVSQVLYENQALTQERVEGGECDVILSPQESVYAVLPENVKPSSLSYRYSHTAQGIDAPVEKGQFISTVEVWNGGICVAQTELYAMNSVDVAQTTNAHTSDTSGDLGQLGSVLLTILIILIVFIFVVFISRRLRLAVKRKKNQRNRRNRRRSR